MFSVMALDRPGYFLDRLELAARGPAKPAFEELARA
jgi:hypothetical protein